MGNLRVGHWYNSGDLITILPGLQHIFETKGIKTDLYQKLDLPAGYFPGSIHPVVNSDGEQVCMNKGTFEAMRPLIEAQDYISSFNEWKSEKVDWDMLRIRDSYFIPMPASDIYHWPFFIFPEMACNLSEWSLYVPKESWEVMDKIIVNRTQRYRNPYINYRFLKKHEDKLLFAGTETEWRLFQEENELSFPLLKVDNFLDLASAIQHCKLFIGNQSLCFHLANGVGATRILEVCREFPNTLPFGPDGYAFIYQEALEFYVEKLMQ